MIRKMLILFPVIEAVIRRVPLGSKHSADMGLVWALNCETTALDTKSFMTTYNDRYKKTIFRCQILQEFGKSQC